MTTTSIVPLQLYALKHGSGPRWPVNAPAATRNEGWLAAAFGIAVIVSLAWGAVGWTGTVLKSAAVAIAVMLLDHDCAGPGGLLRHHDAEAARAIYDLLPGTAINIVAVLFGRSTAGVVGRRR